MIPQYAIIAGIGSLVAVGALAGWLLLASPPRPRARAGARGRGHRAAAERARAGRHGRAHPGRAPAADGPRPRRHRCEVVRGHDLRQRAHGRVDRDRQARPLHVSEPARHALRPRRGAAPARARRARRGLRAVRAAARTSRRAGRATCLSAAELVERYRRPERDDLERLLVAFAPHWDRVKAAIEPVP